METCRSRSSRRAALSGAARRAPSAGRGAGPLPPAGGGAARVRARGPHRTGGRQRRGSAPAKRPGGETRQVKERRRTGGGGRRREITFSPLPTPAERANTHPPNLRIWGKTCFSFSKRSYRAALLWGTLAGFPHLQIRPGAA